MKWSIPAKTFLLGEYAALAEASAIVLTTTPCFELTLKMEPELTGIHPDSPAGLWWQQQKHKEKGLFWHDPYAGQGGLGASSAQFLGSYLANCFLQDETPSLKNLLQAYYQTAWKGTGLRPSGYDIIAQSQQGCVYINKQKKIIQTYTWPFQDLSFFLIHTGVKLATHHHLQNTTLPQHTDDLSCIVDEAKHALEQKNSGQLITCINQYQHKLTELNLVAEHSLNSINQLKKHREILAIKGCGALGADVILTISSTHDAPLLKNKLKSQKWTVLATEKNMYLQRQFHLKK